MLHNIEYFLKVFGELLVDSQQLLMVTVATALSEMGYEIQVHMYFFTFSSQYELVLD